MGVQLKKLNEQVMVITGAGRGFCAGADVKFMDELMRRDDVEEFRRLLGAGRRVLTTIRQMAKPVVAAPELGVVGHRCGGAG